MKMLKRLIPILLVVVLLVSASCSNDTAPPQTGDSKPESNFISTEGTAISNADEFINALENGGSYHLTSDIKVDRDTTKIFTINSNVNIHLNSHIVELSGVEFEIREGGILSLRYGNVNFANPDKDDNNAKGYTYAFRLYSNSELKLHNINMKSDIAGIEIQNQVDSVNLVINRSNIEAGGYVIIYDDIAPNETKTDIYTDATNVNIDINDSYITAVYTIPDEHNFKHNTAAFVINCSGANVNAIGTIFKGDRQAYIARGGYHIIEDCEMHVTGLYDGYYADGTRSENFPHLIPYDVVSGDSPPPWQYKNFVASGGLIVGGFWNTKVQFPVTVKISNTKIKMKDVCNENYYGYVASRNMANGLSYVSIKVGGHPSIEVGDDTIPEFTHLVEHIL